MQKMVIDVLKENENSTLFLTLLRAGVIPLSVLDRKCYYEYYLQQCAELKKLTKSYKMLAVQNTCDEFSISEKTVYNAIKLMEVC